MMQLDIFGDSRQTTLRNDAMEALLQREAVAAVAARDALRTEFPADEQLPALAVLIDALAPPRSAMLADHEAVAEARRGLVDGVEPAASRVLGRVAGTRWVAALWSQLAQRAAHLPFRAEHADSHSAAQWLRAGDWPAAAEAVRSIASWRRIPVPLAWMTEAHFRNHGLDTSWPLLAELAWLAPARFTGLTQRLADPVLDTLQRRFNATFDDADDPAWLPAWALIEQPALASRLRDTQPSLGSPPEQAMRLMLELLGLERQGRQHELPARRKVLRDLQPNLYAAYMKTR